ncbi:uncharacterized protein AKAW2_60711A [Aspergillus luchuensis]|uniref:BTB domain-containing protein n=1 Tax=Aspergillus kawachii TaxID=1069201 RepID=A0A146FZP1_ASPKA|nr:uncharacterized protein AKAW2_60711A [Aspergillus luchuensis]BCS02447.1 hypothetical protein AKAW2_60711A [Aspergillus luchuensis]BCS14121.1 hypothetical protein ALUC_60677A [Aspergillus luchuensis]GAA86336.1 hypothetical protein AKAW_04450 [Aspergillus luchuensis IFO 4308]GAT30402.1 hypothetical protein RIB2604_03303840 [Aspergillus luchuensis]
MDAPQVQVGAPETSSNVGNESESTYPTQKTGDRDVDVTAPSSGVNERQADSTEDIDLPDAGAAEPETAPALPKKNPGFQFLDFLKSPIVELVVGTGESKTSLSAHQSLLLESPILAEKVTALGESSARRIELPEENVEAFGYFLQFQYTRDYSASQLETPTEQEAVSGEIDDSGEQLLKHARVYTLADKLGIPALKTLAHSKIHRINSTSHGEIAYARYVYMNTPVDDVTIRKPVATFWALRSHILRHEAEEEFRKLCIEVPQFSFDVLSLVLDQKEKRAQDKAESESAVKGSGRKRLRSGL